MTITSHRINGSVLGVRPRLSTVVPPLAALLYPFALKGFNGSVTEVVDRGGRDLFSSLAAVVYLGLAFAIPLVALLVAASLSRIADPTAAQLRAKRVALFAVAAPTLFTFVGVILYMLHDPVPDTWLWVSCWVIVVAVLLRSDNERPARPVVRPVPGPLRIAHGVTAVALVTIFLGLHITNHLLFPAGPDAYQAVMQVFRHVYRAEFIQPMLVTLFLFQVGTGLCFVWRATAAPSDPFRTFQIASGIYLAFYVLGHMNSVFIFARTYLSIDTGWGFATGAPTGLIRDPWNIRLVPHYWLGVFFVLSHLAAGGRVILMAHGIRKALANRFMIGGAVIAGIAATVIILGMCGMRVQFV